jgi:hypothetical protein
MCDKLAAAKSLSFVSRGAFDVPAANDEPLFYMTLSEVMMQRPDKLKVIVAGDGPPSEFYCDGKTMMAFLPKDDVVAVADAPDNAEAMLEAAYEKAGIYFPFCRFRRRRFLQDARWSVERPPISWRSPTTRRRRRSGSTRKRSCRG